jgi:anti-sigma B factor antagonist
MDDKVNIEITRHGNAAVVAFMSASIGDVDAVADISRQVKKFVEIDKPTGLIFDFKHVKFFSSLVLGLLLDVRARLKNHNGEVVISSINPQLHRVFRITNLDKIFKFYPDLDSAIKTLC